MRRAAAFVAIATGGARAWSLTFDASSGTVTSLSSGASELADAVTTAANLPTFWLGDSSPSFFKTVLDEPCAEGFSVSTSHPSRV